jgi:uncharacterized protein (DUF2236 family)
MIWRVSSQPVMLLGSSCALLLQLAHPLVAAGVADHSDFTSHPLRRFRRTYDSLFSGLVFGNYRHAMAAARRIHLAHERVNGFLHEDLGAHPAGTPYDANDLPLLIWVHSTLVYTGIATYEAFVRKLGDRERDEFFADTKRFGELLGIPKERFARNWIELQDDMARAIEEGQVCVGANALRLSESVFRPHPLARGPLVHPLRVITAGLLPERLRAQYRLRWGSFERANFSVYRAVHRSVVNRLPSWLGMLPPARRAQRRLRRS